MKYDPNGLDGSRIPTRVCNLTRPTRPSRPPFPSLVSGQKGGRKIQTCMNFFSHDPVFLVHSFAYLFLVDLRVEVEW